MTVSSPDPESAGPAPPPTYLRWPPPGLERLQGDADRIIGELLVGGGLLVLPLLLALRADGELLGAGPFGDSWWILLATTAIGLFWIGSAAVKSFRLLDRARRAVGQGYDVKTVALVAADAGRDTGFLLQGARAFSTLDVGTRGTLARGRLWTAGSRLAAATWLPVGFVFGVLLAARGWTTYGGLLALALAPSLVLFAIGYLWRSWENGILRAARRKWHTKRWAQDLEREEIRAWRAAFLEEGGDGPAGGALTTDPTGRSGLALRTASWAVAALALLVTVPSVVLVVGSSTSPVLVSIAAPQYGSVQNRAAATEALWRHRIPPERGVTPQDAGRSLRAIEQVGSRRPEDGGRPAATSYAEPFFPGETSHVNPVGIPNVAWSDRLFAALDTITPAGIAYLREVAAHPALEEISIVARADSLDMAAGFWPDRFREGVTTMSIPIPRFGVLRSAGYAAIGKAGLELVDGRPDLAEETLRETLTYGLLLARDSPTIISNLIGVVVATQAGSALASYYRRVGRVEEAATLEWSLDLAERVAAAATAGAGDRTVEIGSMPRLVLDRSLPRGQRWETFALLSTVAPCMNVRRIVFGPDDDFREWSERARASLVAFPSEEAYYDLMSRGWTGTAGDGAPRTTRGKIFALAMGGGRPGSCARMLEGLVLEGLDL